MTQSERALPRCTQQVTKQGAKTDARWLGVQPSGETKTHNPPLGHSGLQAHNPQVPLLAVLGWSKATRHIQDVAIS